MDKKPVLGDNPTYSEWIDAWIYELYHNPYRDVVLRRIGKRWANEAELTFEQAEKILLAEKQRKR